jgi:hypothetical protein
MTLSFNLLKIDNIDGLTIGRGTGTKEVDVTQ